MLNLEHNDLHQFICMRIEQLVASSDTNYRQLSLDINKTDSYINKIMSGIMPPLPVIDDICHIFHITLKDFFDTELNSPIEYVRAKKLLKHASSERIKAICTLLEQEKP